MPPLSAELLASVEQLGSACSGDVPGLVQQVRALAPGPFANDSLLAQALEAAAIKCGTAQDRTSTWWLSCAVAMVRPSPFGSAQEEAELNAARALGELWQSAAAKGPLPEGARWIVAGVGEPPPTASTVELARRNAAAHLERLQEELGARLPTMRARLEAGQGAPEARRPIEEAIASYEAATQAVRAALSRAVDGVIARGRDVALTAAGAHALSTIDERGIVSLQSRVAEARALLGQGSTAMVETLLDRGDRVSFVGAPPPSLRRSPSSVQQTHVAVSESTAGAPAPTRESLDADMRVAFETAWSNPGQETRQAFVRAVRARYELETASIPDAEERQRAIEHYVAHALSQLPPAG